MWGDSIAACNVVVAVHKSNAEEMQCVMNNMKNGEASGLTRVVLEMLKTGGADPFWILWQLYSVISCLRVSCHRNGCWVRWNQS